MSLQAFSVCYKEPHGNDANHCSYIKNFHIQEICDLIMEMEQKTLETSVS